MAQRIVRAKAKIRDARIPYHVPSHTELPDRLDTVLHVIYLVFNEGYSPSSGQHVTRHDLSGEAIRLGRLLVELLPEPEAMGLLALMLLHESRRAARASPAGELVLLDEQDRSLWNRAQIAEGASLVERALAVAPVRPVHASGGDCGGARRGADAASTDWAQIVGLYDVLLRADPITGRRTEPRGRRGDARRSGGGLELIDAHPVARRSEGLPPRALGARRSVSPAWTDCRSARSRTERALSLVQQEPERRFLERRLRECSQSVGPAAYRRTFRRVQRTTAYAFAPSHAGSKAPGTTSVAPYILETVSDDALSQLNLAIGEVVDLQHAAALLEWDEQVYMPPGGAAVHGEMIATIKKTAHEKFTSDADGRVDRRGSGPTAAARSATPTHIEPSR